MFKLFGFMLPACALCLIAGCSADTGNQVAAEPLVPGTVAYDKSVFLSLIREHAKVRREVTILPNGAATLTESDDPEVAAKLVDHVNAMKSRLHDGRRVRQWDPLYVAIFDEAEKIDLKISPTAKGVRIVETSDDPHVAEMIKAHARVVSGFAREGMDEFNREHEVPPPPGGTPGAAPGGG